MESPNKKSKHSKAFDYVVQTICEMENVSLLDAFVTLTNSLKGHDHTSLLRSVFVQFLKRLEFMLDDTVLAHAPHYNCCGSLVCPSAESDFISTSDGGDVAEMSWYGRDAFLVKYVEAAKREFGDTKHISICGPDATKVGTDLAITMAYMMNKLTRTCACSPPQVFFSINL